MSLHPKLGWDVRQKMDNPFFTPPLTPDNTTMDQLIVFQFDRDTQTPINSGYHEMSGEKAGLNDGTDGIPRRTRRVAQSPRWTTPDLGCWPWIGWREHHRKPCPPSNIRLSCNKTLNKNTRAMAPIGLATPPVAPPLGGAGNACLRPKLKVSRHDRVSFAAIALHNFRNFEKKEGA